MGAGSSQNHSLQKPRARLTDTASDHLTARRLGLLNQASNLFVRRLPNDGPDKVLDLGRRADGDLADLLDELLLEPARVPHRLGDVTPGQGRALLTLVLERRADGLNDARADVGSRVVQVEVFAARLADDPRVALVNVEILRNVLPQLAEDLSGSGKVKTSKVPVVNALLDDVRGRALMAWC